MNDVTDKQRIVIDAAKKELREKFGLGQVCLDQLMSDEEIDRNGLEEAVGTLVIDTCYWEGMFP